MGVSSDHALAAIAHGQLELPDDYMSRVPPFPSTRAQPASGSDFEYGSASSQSTRPLQINRTRPTTPSRNAPLSSSPTTISPARPQRSDLRGRNVQDYGAPDRLSIDSSVGDYRDRRDSGATTRSDRSQPPPRPPRGNVQASSSTTNGTLRPPPVRSPTSPGDELSPSEQAALAMFQSVMAKKKRGMTDDDYLEQEYEKEKERELAIQQDRQRRLRERVPGRKATKPRAGDIDGARAC